MNGTTISAPKAPITGPGKRSRPVLTTSTLLLIIGASAVSFVAGTMFALGFNHCASVDLSKPEEHKKAKPSSIIEAEIPSRGNPIFPQTVNRFAVGMAHVKKEDFTKRFELGVALDQPTPGSEDVLMLYSRQAALPDKQKKSQSTSITEFSAEEAVENCDWLNVIFSYHEGRRNQCWAILPQYESYHIQKWMRLNGEGKLDHEHDFKLVARGHQENGVETFQPPHFQKHTRRSWELLKTYLESVDDVLAELKPIVNKIKRKNTVIVMVCNHGQSELLINFACSTHARNLDISNVLVFATDEETKELAESVGLAAFYDQRNFGHITTKAAETYGDRHFTAMMMAKVVCVQLISLLGVDMLFQDVDIVWYKNPLEFFWNKDSPIHNYDLYYQDDGSHSTRYAPYSPNSGFYFVRHNQRTQHFLTSLLMAGDLVLKTFSHQQAMTAVLAEHASLFGLRVKVLSRDEDDFPGGYHFHRQNGKFLKAMFEGEKQPYIFHMSWTKSKDNKLLFLRQMGEWYLQDHCIAKKLSDMNVESENFVAKCCSKEALVTCHFKDKPSITPCKDSPALDGGGKSFW